MLATRMLMAAAGSAGSLDLLKLPDATVVANYRADTVTDDGSGAVSIWPDRSPNGHSLSQGAGVNRPAAIADGGADFSNKPVVRFDGSNDYLQSGTGFVQAQPLTIIAFAKNTLFSGTSKFLFEGRTSGSAGRCRINWNVSEIINFTAGSALTGTSGNNVPLAIEAVCNGANSALRVNSLVEASGNAGTGGVVNGITLGAASGPQSYMGGDIAELVIVDGVLTDADRSYLALYANQRYGIPLPFPEVKSVTPSIFNALTTSHNVAMPATVQAGELLLTLMALRAENDAISVPAGWSRVGEADGPRTFDVFAKKADGSEGGTTVNFASGIASTAVAQTYRVGLRNRGLDGVAVSLFAGAGSFSSAPNPPELIAPWGSLNTLWIAAGMAAPNGVNFAAAPAGYTGLVNTVAAGNVSMGSAWRNFAASSSDNPGVFSISALQSWRAVTIGIRPLV